MNQRIKIIFTVSVLLNVVLIGLAAGYAYKSWAAHPWHKVKEQLEPETRHIVGRNFQGAFRDIRPLGDKARKVRAELIKILSADEFDEEAFEREAKKLQGLRGDMVDIKIETVKKLSRELGIDERVKLADRMVRMIGGGREMRVKRKRSVRPMKPDHKPEFKAGQSE